MTQTDAYFLTTEVERLGDRCLALTYLALTTIERASAYGEILEREMVGRYCAQNAMIPEMAND